MRIYSIELPVNSALTAAATTLVETSVASGKILYLLRAWVSQKTNTTSTIQDIQLAVQSSTGTSVSAPLANKADNGDAAYSGTLRGLCTAQGAISYQLYADSFDWKNGWIWQASYLEQFVVSNSGIVGLRLPTAPGALTINAGIVVGEVG